MSSIEDVMRWSQSLKTTMDLWRFNHFNCI